MSYKFTCKYDTAYSAAEEAENMADGRVLISYNPGKDNPGMAAIVIGFATWGDMVDFTSEYLCDIGEAERGNTEGEAYVYGYLLKYARCPDSGW